ncbi:MAG: response regulator [Halorhabdus sp.]
MGDTFRVLVVDDDPAIAEMIGEFLPREDDRFDVDTATAATAALDRLDDGYDAIISDYQMPEMNGIEFLETVRNDRDSDIPFLIFTGRGREEVAMEALNLGADRYLQKGGAPSSQYGVLADAVANEIEKQRAAAELEALNTELEARNNQLEAYTHQLEAIEHQLRAEIEQRKENEEELICHKQLLDTLFDFVSIHLFIKNSDGRHRWVSSELYDEPDRWIGKRDTEVEYPVSEKFSETALADDLRVLEDGERIIDKEEYAPRQEKYFLTSKVPWRDSEGKII